MVWTYCSACGSRTEWASGCSKCGSANPLYSLSLPDQIHGDAKQAELLNTASNTFWQSWGYFAGVLLVSLITLAVILVVPALSF
jgi:hypothetical protein